MRSGFRRQMYHRPGSVYNLREFSEWLQYEAWCQSSETQISYKSQRPERRRETKPTVRSATILHGADDTATKVLSAPVQVKPVKVEKPKVPPRAFYPYCDNEDHYLSQCPTFKSFDKQKMIEWIQTNHRCWRCGRAHQAAQCTLKKPCSICKGKHLQILHEVNTKSPREGSCLVSSMLAMCAGTVFNPEQPEQMSRHSLQASQLHSNSSRAANAFKSVSAQHAELLQIHSEQTLFL